MLADCVLCGQPLVEGDSNIELICLNGHKQSVVLGSDEPGESLLPSKTKNVHKDRDI
jgi:hypothetical protein